MKIRLHPILFFLAFVSPLLHGLTLVDPVRMGGAEGTGETTGTVVILELVNPGGETRRVVLGPYLIPATGDYQGYLIPGGQPFEVPAGERVRVPLQGFCTDIRRPPVPGGERVLDPGSWFTPSILWTPEPPSAGAEGWHPPAEFRGGAFRPASELPEGGRPYVPLYPGTDVPIPWTVDINEDPEAAAPLAFKIYDEIARTYRELEEAGKIDTPYGGNPERQREAIVQQVFWLAMASLEGRDPYEEEDFEERLIEQFETATGTPMSEQPAPRREKFEEGADDFWGAIELTGASAKVIRVNTGPEGEPEPEPEPQPEPEPEPEPEPAPAVREKGPCEEELGAPGGGLRFSRGGASVTIQGNRLTINPEDGEPLTWDFETDVQDALQNSEPSSIRGETTSVRTQGSAGGETVETGSSVDLTVAAPDPSTQEQPMTTLSFTASVVGPDGKLREYSVSVSLDLETCTWMMQVVVEDDVSEFATHPPRPANIVARDLARSDKVNSYSAWRTPGFWTKMFSLYGEIARWYGWLDENPDPTDRMYIREAWNRWINKMEHAIYMARERGDLTEAQSDALDAMEDALEEAYDNPLDPGVLEAFIGAYNAFAHTSVPLK